jgi:hypothetical protein
MFKAIPKILCMSLAGFSASSLNAQQTQQSQQLASLEAPNALNKMAADMGIATQNLNPDELAAAIADRVPGFAGVHLKEDGTQRMLFTARSQVFQNGRPTPRQSMPSAPSQLMRSLETEQTTQPEVAQAQFDAKQMLTFKKAAFDLRGANGVVWVDIDEAANRLRIGAKRALEANELEGLQQRLVQAGLPSVSFTLESTDPLVRVQAQGSLRTQSPPVAGGAQIGFNSNGGSFVCSVGVPAVRNGVTGFVTASHCSDTVYGADQSGASTYSAGNAGAFATEAVDPGPINCQSRINQGSAGQNCRRSDSLFARTNSPSDVQLGRIYLTNAGSLNISGSLQVSGTVAYPGLNQAVSKTGRTTGTTNGRVTQTCVDAAVSENDGDNSPDYGVLCATVTNVRVQGGDSGSALFVREGASSARVGGVLSFGGGIGSGFSPWGQITQDLGTLTVR